MALKMRIPTPAPVLPRMRHLINGAGRKRAAPHLSLCELIILLNIFPLLENLIVCTVPPPLLLIL
jgi:hypothetical protein